jgi:adenylate kinase family enzyme
LRIRVVGTSGSGKSTLARALAAQLDLPLLELDSIFHLANWTPLPEQEFVSKVDSFAAAENWIVDGNYSVVSDVLNQQMTHIVWLDYPRWFVMQRLIRRTAWRALSRQPLWNGNREHPLSWLKRDPEENILLWAWMTHTRNRERYALLFESIADVEKIRIGSPREASRLLKQLTA